MAFLKLLLAFLPWLAFLVIAHSSLFRLKLGLAVALLLSVAMGIGKLHRGVILWVGLSFFVFATLAVVAFNDMWTVRHMGILANGTLAASTWLTVVFRRPFTLDYAREHVDPSLWNEPSFIRTNMVITSVWAAVFTANALLAWSKMEHLLLSDLAYEVLSYALLVATAAFTIWYPKQARRQREFIAASKEDVAK
jgi:hypothetical protein